MRTKNNTVAVDILSANLLLARRILAIACLIIVSGGCNPLGKTSESTSTDESAATVIRPTAVALSGPTTVVAGLCSSPFTIKTTVGLTSIAASVSAATTLMLTTSASGAFYSDSACSPGSTVTSVSIASGKSSAEVYFKSNTAETVTLTALGTIEGRAATISGPMTISAAVPYSVALTQAISSTAQIGSSFATQPIVTLKDSTDATYSTTSSVTASAFTDASCTSAASGTLANATVTAVAGVGTFTNLSYNQAETIYLKYAFSSQSVSSSCVGPITITTPCDATAIAASPFASGDGSLGTPYLICTTTQWNNIAATAGYMSKYFELKSNLDFGSNPANFTPVGSSATAFTGQIAGNSFTISNVAINATNGGNQSKSGIFRNLGAGAYIHDLNISSVTYSQTVAGNANIGAIVGYAAGSSWPANGGSTNVVRLSNINVTGTINMTIAAGTGTDGHIGGFAGSINYTVVSGVTLNATSGDLTAAGYNQVGGFIGYSQDNNSISTSSTNLAVANSEIYAGGFIGYQNGCGLTVTTSKASGSVTGKYGYLGGFLGASNCNPSISNSAATGNVTRTSTGTWYGTNYGGFCGSSCTATNSYATGDVRTADTLSTRKGGFCGGSCTITNSYSTGNIMYYNGSAYVQDTTSSEAGGLCGQNSGCTVTNSYWSKDTSLASSPGGGVGVTSALLKDRTFLITNGWSFTSTWRTPPASPSVYNNNDFPILQWETSDYVLPTVASLLTGSGTIASPYLLSTATDLTNIPFAIQIDSNVATARFKIPNGSTIDFTGMAAPAIGSSATPFRGEFDGNGQTISNLSTTSTHSYSGSLFNYLGAGAYVHDLVISGVSLTHASAGFMYTGGVIGYAAGSAWDSATICDASTLASATTASSTKVRICNISVSGAVSVSAVSNSGNAAYPGVGGFIGAMTYTSISNVTVNASSGGVSAPGNVYVGGFLGYSITQNSISQSSSNVAVLSADSNAGGFVGYHVGCTATPLATNSKASGDVTGSYGFLGGFLGNSNCTIGITTSVATGTVTSSTAVWYAYYVGGFCGGGCSATNSYSTGNVRSADNAADRRGGFCGGGCTITNSYSVGDVLIKSGGVYIRDTAVVGTGGNINTGGLCGGTGGAGNCTVYSSYWSTDTSTPTSIGGGTGISSATLKDKTFLVGNLWSFSSVWRTPPASPSIYNNNDFPILQWETSGYTLPTVASLLPSGTGTSADPYLITSETELRNIHYAMQIDSSVASAHFKIPLATTLNLTNLAAPAIGSSTIPFRGEFDGNSQTISNLSTISTHSNSGTLFNYLGAGAYIHDLNISGAALTHNATGYMYTGAVVGYAAGSAWDAATICDATTLASTTTSTSTKVRICNIAVTGDVSVSVLSNNSNAAYPGVGGFIGAMTNTAITNVTVTSTSGGVTAAGNQFVGGFLGYAISRNAISKVSTNTSVLSTDINAGGFLGYQYDGVCTQTTIDQSKASGNVTGTYGFLGGFLGNSNCWAGIPITNSVATGTVTSTTAVWYAYYVGGFCGGTCNATNSYSTGDVRAESNVADRRGGFCGGGCHITNSYSRGDVLIKSAGSYIRDTAVAMTGGNVNTGGLCGATGSASTCTISNSFWDADVSTPTSIGGGTGLTTSQLQTAATLNASGANWSTAIWNLNDGDYPKLIWEGP